MNLVENAINSIQMDDNTILIKAKAYTQSSIDSTYYFYYFTYNNVSDFSSGYSDNPIITSQDSYVNSVSITNNSDNSPLAFLDNVEIKEIKFIPETRYAYYKIYNQDKEITYYGLIDIKLNKVIYNFESDNNTIIIHINFLLYKKGMET